MSRAREVRCAPLELVISAAELAPADCCSSKQVARPCTTTVTLHFVSCKDGSSLSTGHSSGRRLRGRAPAGGEQARQVGGPPVAGARERDPGQRGPAPLQPARRARAAGSAAARLPGRGLVRRCASRSSPHVRSARDTVQCCRSGVVSAMQSCTLPNSRYHVMQCCPTGDEYPGSWS